MSLQSLIDASICTGFCLPDNQLPEQTYLAGTLAGLDMSNTDALADLVKCWQCYDDPTLAQIEAYALSNLSGGNVSGTLEEAASCYVSCTNPQILQWLETYLYCTWLQNDPPITDIMQIYTGAFADPNGNVTPTDPTKAALYYQDSVANNIWRWSVADQVWYQLIAP